MARGEQLDTEKGTRTWFLGKLVGYQKEYRSQDGPYAKFVEEQKLKLIDPSKFNEKILEDQLIDASKFNVTGHELLKILFEPFVLLSGDQNKTGAGTTLGLLGVHPALLESRAMRFVRKKLRNALRFPDGPRTGLGKGLEFLVQDGNSSTGSSLGSEGSDDLSKITPDMIQNMLKDTALGRYVEKFRGCDGETLQRKLNGPNHGVMAIHLKKLKREFEKLKLSVTESVSTGSSGRRGSE